MFPFQSLEVSLIRNNVRRSVSLAIMCASLSTITQTTFAKTQAVHVDQQTIESHQRFVLPNHQPKIQMAILLDTSNSMDGLIDQARNQLWSVVNEFSTAKHRGVSPVLEVALFEYGNDGNSMSNGYVRQLNSFTRELDRVSEGLFSLKTNGGSEFCGFAIQSAVNNLQWSQSNNDIKVIFIAGNEAFTQGPVDYQKAISLARQQGISVNTIFAGDFQTGANSGWKSGAMLAGGDYMSIDADRQIVHIDAPQDKRIAALNSKLNETYVPYGEHGKASAERQLEQDKNNRSISSGLLAKRAKSKSSSFYNNRNWDLVDALKDGTVKEADLASLKEDQLPAPMKSMSAGERKDYVKKQSEARDELKREITELSKSREKYVAEKRTQQVEESASMSDALSVAVRNQAKKKGFELGGEG